MSEKDICSRCNKPLVKTPCYVCGGSGAVRKWLISKEECIVCNGSGIQFKCPDEFNHFMEDLKKRTQSRMPEARAIEQEYQSPQSRINVTINSLIRKGTIPPPDWWRKTHGLPLPIDVPPWDYRYPYPWHPNHPRNPNRFLRK